MGDSEREAGLGCWNNGCYEIEDTEGDAVMASATEHYVYIEPGGQALIEMLEYTPAQARALAGALVKLADEIDPPSWAHHNPRRSFEVKAEARRNQAQDDLDYGVEALARATAERYAERFKERFVEKYMAGQREHGGHLPSLPYRELRKNTEDELLDLWAYHCAEGEAVRRLLSPDFRSGDGYANNTKVPRSERVASERVGEDLRSLPPLPEDWT